MVVGHVVQPLPRPRHAPLRKHVPRLVTQGVVIGNPQDMLRMETGRMQEAGNPKGVQPGDDVPQLGVIRALTEDFEILGNPLVVLLGVELRGFGVAGVQIDGLLDLLFHTDIVSKKTEF